MKITIKLIDYNYQCKIEIKPSDTPRTLLDKLIVKTNRSLREQFHLTPFFFNDSFDSHIVFEELYCINYNEIFNRNCIDVPMEQLFPKISEITLKISTTSEEEIDLLSLFPASQREIKRHSSSYQESTCLSFDIDSKNYEEVCSILLSKKDQLTDLTLHSREDLSISIVESVLKSLVSHPRLISLTLIGFILDVEKKPASILSNVLQRLTHLEYLSLSRQRFTSNSLNILKIGLVQLKKLKTFGFFNMDIIGSELEALKVMANIIAELPELTEFNFNNSGFGVGESKKSMSVLIEMISSIPKLTALHLSNHSIDTEALGLLTPVLKKKDTLSALNLRNNSFSAAAAKTFLNEMRVNAMLSYIDFSGVFSDEDEKNPQAIVTMMGKAVKENVNVVCLEFHSEAISLEGSKTVYQLLAKRRENRAEIRTLLAGHFFYFLSSNLPSIPPPIMEIIYHYLQPLTPHLAYLLETGSGLPFPKVYPAILNLPFETSTRSEFFIEKLSLEDVKKVNDIFNPQFSFKKYLSFKHEALFIINLKEMIESFSPAFKIGGALLIKKRLENLFKIKGYHRAELVVEKESIGEFKLIIKGVPMEQFESLVKSESETKTSSEISDFQMKRLCR